MSATLVSVIIAAYNSSPFIVATLESISKQTWRDIELIITDDCSKDDTVELCRSWINQNRNRFVRAEIFTSEINTGVPANANRGFHVANGIWLKFLAGDDTLKSTCIEDNMTWITSHPEVKVLFSRIDVYKNTIEPTNFLETIPGDPFQPQGIMALGRTVKSQYKMLLLGDKIHFTPSLFINREILLSVGAFDERFRLLEDYPLWLNLTRNGNKLSFMDKVTVNYRRHSKAINNTGIPCLINPNYFKQEDFRKVYTYPHLPAIIRLNQQFNWYLSQIFRFEWLNKNKKPNRFLLALLTTYMNPFKYYIYLKKRLVKSLKDNEFYV